MHLLDPKAKSVGVPSDFNPDRFGRIMNLELNEKFKDI
jgi:hypothetical protein